MRQFRPEGPKKTIEEICAKYGLFFNPDKKFTHLTITDRGTKIQIHPKDLNPFSSAELYHSCRYKETYNFEYTYNTTLIKPTKVPVKFNRYNMDKTRKFDYTSYMTSEYILLNENIPAW